MPNPRPTGNVPEHATSRRSRLRLAAQGLAVLLALVGHSAQAQDASFPETVRRSGFIFIGTVEAVGEATASIVPQANSAVVVVDSILEALPPVGDPTGQKVTVQLRDPQSLRPGDQVAFFTYVQTAGETLGLVEVARESSDGFETLRQRIAAARQSFADAALNARLARAEVVVVGVVGSTAPTEAAGRPLSEHDPLWWRALIRVETFEKGRLAIDSVDVYFATNVDYRWADAPKLVAGEEGIFLLQRDPEQRFRLSGFFLTDRLDKLPRNDLARVRQLLEGLR